MPRQIDHLETAKELLEVADEMGDWTDDALPKCDRWAIGQLNLASVAHALIAQAETAEDVATR